VPSSPMPYTVEQLEAEPGVDLPSFSRDDAVRLGELAVQIARERGLNLAIDVHVGAELAFRAQLGSTGQRNADTIAGKRLVVEKFRHSSLLARMKKDADPTVADGLGDEYKFWGGSIPIFVNGVLYGTISSSGEEDVVDHRTIADALSRFLSESPA
jgi:uncharacterized protein (UPF0303 family)